MGGWKIFFGRAQNERRQSMTQDEQQRRMLHAAGHTAKQIADKLQYSYSAIRDWHERRGLTCNGGTGRGGRRKTAAL